MVFVHKCNNSTTNGGWTTDGDRYAECIFWSRIMREQKQRKKKLVDGLKGLISAEMLRSSLLMFVAKKHKIIEK